MSLVWTYATVGRLVGKVPACAFCRVSVIGNGSNKLGTESGNDKLSSRGLMGYFRGVLNVAQSVRFSAPTVMLQFKGTG